MFVFDTAILDPLEDRDDRRVNFIHRSLIEIDEKLKKLGSRLVVKHGNPEQIIPELAKKWQADFVVCAEDYEPTAIERDDAVRQKLHSQGIEFRSVKDQVIFSGGEVSTPEGAAYRVYSPFAKNWRAKFSPELASELEPSLDHLAPAEPLQPFLEDWSLTAIGFDPAEVWVKPGEDAAQEQLEKFARERMSGYKKARDFPAVNGTSVISPHLRFGTISCRAAVRAALEVSGEGGDKWLSELIWREFYSMILLRYPEVVNHTFRPEFDDLEYPGTSEYFEAWVEGRTGYPIVDAAMRCFEATGWMHNRLRMVVASFLTKDLLVDYKWGEAYFARKLLDFDLASNNGSWQWAASVGADPQPYFRIFNPILQSKKFDSEGKFIREWCPELKGFSNERIHFPAEALEMEQELAGCLIGKDYPAPIVDHSEQRQKAIALLERALDRSKNGT